jgi:hypothetical protein
MEHLQKTIWPKHTRLITLASMGFTLVVLKALRQFVAPRLGEVKRYFWFGSGFHFPMLFTKTSSEICAPAILPSLTKRDIS